MTIVIAGVQKVSLLDYPGRIAATVFLAGCNLDCGYCHNRWMLHPAEVRPAMSVDDLLRWLGTRRGKLDGVCISGGEPLLQSDLPELLGAIRGLGLALKLDTNGTLPERLAPLLAEGLLDYVALDLKAPLDERYIVVARRPMEVAAIRRTMALLRAWDGGQCYEYRTTVAPLLDEPALADIARELQPQERWYLQRFLPAEGVDPVLAAMPALDEEALGAVAGRLATLAPGVRVRGVK